MNYCIPLIVGTPVSCKMDQFAPSSPINEDKDSLLSSLSSEIHQDTPSPPNQFNWEDTDGLSAQLIMCL